MSRTRTITQKDIDVYNAIYEWYKNNGPRSPNIRDITEMSGLSSTSTCAYSIDKLREICLIKPQRKKGDSRDIRLSGERWEMPDKTEFQVCGHPISSLITFMNHRTHHCRDCEREARE
jgi:hypothetical protein